MTEGAEYRSPGRDPSAGAPLLSIHAFKVIVGPVERSMRRAPRPPTALGALRVKRLPWPLSFKGSDALIILDLINDSDPLAVLRASALLRVKHGCEGACPHLWITPDDASPR